MIRDKIPNENFGCRSQNCFNCKSGESLVSKVAESDMEATDVSSAGEMIFEAILEDGVFRFDCSIDDRTAAYPSLSFTDPKTRETPVKSSRVPQFIPTFESKLGKQVINIQVCF